MLSFFRKLGLVFIFSALATAFTPLHCLANSAACALSLPAIAKQTMKIYFTGNAAAVDKFAQQVTTHPQYRQACGVFVTLSQNGQTKACWGTLEPQYKNIGQATVYATVSALTKDYRFAPIAATGWQQLKVQVTVTKKLEPITSLSQLNPLADGLLVRAGGKSAVILPGECCDAYYQLVRAKLKAGIRSKEPYQMFRIAADVYR
jgi:AMMECR1 domain-containing protein